MSKLRTEYIIYLFPKMKHYIRWTLHGESDISTKNLLNYKHGIQNFGNKTLTRPRGKNLVPSVVLSSIILNISIVIVQLQTLIGLWRRVGNNAQNWNEFNSIPIEVFWSAIHSFNGQLLLLILIDWNDSIESTYQRISFLEMFCIPNKELFMSEWKLKIFGNKTHSF